MRTAMTSQQNLKRREAAFLLGATAFRTREMQIYHGVGFFAIHFSRFFSRFLILKNGENPLFYAGSRRFVVVSYKP